MFTWKKFLPQNFDWPLMVAVLLLVALGLEAIYSVDLSRGNTLILFKKQLVAVIIGLVGVVILSVTQSNVFKTIAKFYYSFSLVLLVLVLFFGKQIRGTKGWFVVGGFSIQPVEMAKIALILLLAYIIAHFGRRFERPLFFFGTGLISFVLMFLTMLQPDLGSALILGFIWFGMMCLVGIRRLFLILVVGSAVLLGFVSWKFYLNDKQKARFVAVINPQAASLTSGYNVIQATIAVGSGQIFGKGIGRGSQSQLRFLPEAHTDFIFSVIAEELGFVGVVIMLVLFGIVLWRFVVIMERADDDFVVFTVGGIALLLFVQFFINVGAEIGIFPLTGVTVPFVSYGGSSMIIDLFMIGIAQSMIARKY
jgi:rod shape determining protein RodA